MSKSRWTRFVFSCFFPSRGITLIPIAMPFPPLKWSAISQTWMWYNSSRYNAPDNNKCPSLIHSVMQWAALYCTALYCTLIHITLHFTALHCIEMHCTVLHDPHFFIAVLSLHLWAFMWSSWVYCSSVQCSTVQHSVIQCNAGQCNAGQCNAV